MQAEPLLACAGQELEAARSLLEHGFHAQCVSRAYYAAFYAAEGSLASLDVSRSEHAGVIAAFGQLAVKQHGFPPEAARLLRQLFERRADADYLLEPVTGEEAAAAVEFADRFVIEVREWLDQTSIERSGSSSCSSHDDADEASEADASTAARS